MYCNQNRSYSFRQVLVLCRSWQVLANASSLPNLMPNVHIMCRSVKLRGGISLAFKRKVRLFLCYFTLHGGYVVLLSDGIGILQLLHPGCRLHEPAMERQLSYNDDNAAEHR